MKMLLYLLGLLLVITSCNDISQKKVDYLASGSVSAYNLQHINANGELISTEVFPESAQDTWKYSYMADKGEIVFFSGNYKDINSSLKLMILVDGKVYKQVSSKSDTLSILTVSGTIPY